MFWAVQEKNFNRADSLAAAFQLPLHQIEHFMGYNSGMTVFYEVSWKLTRIPARLLDMGSVV